MNRRSFLKIIGFSFIVPTIAVEILNQDPVTPIIRKGKLSDAVDINSITSKVWAKKWWEEAKKDSYFYSNRKLFFNDKDYGVITIPEWKGKK